MLGIFLGLGLFRLAYIDFGCEIDPEQRLGMAHFLAMGLNEELMGTYSSEDVDFSSSFNNKNERDLADLNLAKERANNMGISGLVKHSARKLLTTFNDGSFAWTLEGTFFQRVFERNDTLAKFTRSFYYTEGSNFRSFLNFEHAIWLAVLFFAPISTISKTKTKECSAIKLSLLGFILYSLLFEVRARYIFIFVPLFLVLSGAGILNAIHILQKHIKGTRI